MQQWRRRQNAVYISFILPAAAFFTAFFIVPFAESLWLAFTDAYGSNTEQHFVGLRNYREALTIPAFRSALWVTV